MYNGNPQYELRLEHNGIRLFTPTNIMDGYSAQRFVEAMNQQIYANAGANKEVLQEVMNEVKRRCNDEKNKSIRTEIGALVESVLYRLQYPVDQHCAVRMGAILCFMEEDIQDKLTQSTEREGSVTVATSPKYVLSEPEDKIDSVWLQRKETLAFSDQKFYDFFLTWGIVNTPLYREHFDILKDSDYFNKRMETIRSLTPIKPSNS